MPDRTPIDPALRRFLNEQAAPGTPLAELTRDARRDVVRARMVVGLQSRTSIAGLPNSVQMHEVDIAPGLPARVYRPAGVSDPLPVLVYLHGGGWVAGSVASHDPFCRLLSEAAAILVVSVEYRLAPEHPYPAQLDDTAAALRWAAQHAAEWGGDSARLALGGDSAGGNLAAVVSNRVCAAKQGPALRGLLLLYPATDKPGAGFSYAENATGYGLEAEAMQWFWNQYLPQDALDEGNTYPLRLRNLPGLPPTLVATAEYDVLRDDGLLYAEKLRAAGVDVTHLHAPDMHHNFPVGPSTVGRFPQCEATLKQMAQWLRTTLA